MTRLLGGLAGAIVLLLVGNAAALTALPSSETDEPTAPTTAAPTTTVTTIPPTTTTTLPPPPVDLMALIVRPPGSVFDRSDFSGAYDTTGAYFHSWEPHNQEGMVKQGFVRGARANLRVGARDLQIEVTEFKDATGADTFAHIESDSGPEVRLAAPFAVPEIPGASGLSNVWEYDNGARTYQHSIAFAVGRRTFVFFVSQPTDFPAAEVVALAREHYERALAVAP